MQRKIKRIILLTFSFIVFLFSINSFANTEQDVTSYFEDENLKNAILEIIKKVEDDDTKSSILLSDIDKITSDSLASGKQLNLSGKNIKSLKGLELFEEKNIEWIYLDWNEIEDLSVLNNFTSLTKVSASSNNISNTAFVNKLSNLQNLNLSNNKINGIGDITYLPKLKYLYLDNNQIEDLTGISRLTKLVDLSISGNKIINCDEITKIESLESLDISRNKISTIANIKTNNSVKKVNLNYNELTSLNGIQNLKNIEILSASNNKIDNIENIDGLSKLYNLNLNKNEIQDISVFNNNSSIKYLYLDANHIIDTSPIDTLTNLLKVTIYNQIYNLNITEKLETEDVKIVFTSIFKELQNKDSKIYVDDVSFQMEPGITYEIANDMSFMIVKLTALEQHDLAFTMKDSDYNYITLNIHYEPIIEPEEPEKISDVYTVKDDKINNVITNTTMEKFIQNLNTSHVNIYRNDMEIEKNTLIGTGDILSINQKNYRIIVKADPSGDGKTNIMDLMKVKKHVIGSSNLNNLQILASDLNEDGYINIMDIMKFVKIITQQK